MDEQQKPKHPGGRPSLCTPDMVRIAYQQALLGATNQDLAKVLDVADTTIDYWIKTQPEFSGALKKGRQVANGEVAASLYQRAIGYSHKAVKIFLDKGNPITVEYTEHYPPDTAAAFIWLKNRMPGSWRDKMEVTAPGVDDAMKELAAAIRNSPKDEPAKPSETPQSE